MHMYMYVYMYIIDGVNIRYMDITVLYSMITLLWT